MQIAWKGNKYTNSSSRRGHKPIAICNHITAGTKLSANSGLLVQTINKVAVTIPTRKTYT